jgi:hypothetical protein
MNRSDKSWHIRRAAVLLATDAIANPNASELKNTAESTLSLATSSLVNAEQRFILV